MSYKRIKKELIETFNLNSQKAYEEFMNSNIYKLITPQACAKADCNIENLVNKYKYLINPNNIWLIYLSSLKDLSNIESTLTKEELKILSDYENIKNVIWQNDFDIYKMFHGCKIETILIYAILRNSFPAEQYLNDLMNIKISITGQKLLLLFRYRFVISMMPLFLDRILAKKLLYMKLTLI